MSSLSLSLSLSSLPNLLVNSPASASFWEEEEERVYSLIRYSGREGGEEEEEKSSR